MRTIKWICILVMPISLVLSCTKNDSVNVVSVHQKLINLKWIIASTVSVDSTGAEKDLHSNLPDFEKDDYLFFNADSTYELNDNQLLRSDTLAVILDAGKWAITQGGTHLELYSNTINTTYRPAVILELNDQFLRIERQYPGDRSKVRTTYQRQ